jgi:hypothetical protein
MGGDIHVSSRVNIGTTVELDLPCVGDSGIAPGFVENASQPEMRLQT